MVDAALELELEEGLDSNEQMRSRRHAIYRDLTIALRIDYLVPNNESSVCHGKLPASAMIFGPPFMQGNAPPSVVG